MPYRIEVKPVEKVAPKDYKVLYRLNLGSWGLMRDRLVESRIHPEENKSLAYMYRDETGKILGWAITFTYKYLSKRVKHRRYFQVFVRTSQRRKGIGKKLLKRALKKEQTVLKVWKSSAEDFFRDSDPTKKLLRSAY